MESTNDDRKIEFCEAALDKCNTDPDVLRKITFFGVFALSETENKHSVNTWPTEIQKLVSKMPGGQLHSMSWTASVSRGCGGLRHQCGDDKWGEVMHHSSR